MDDGSPFSSNENTYRWLKVISRIQDMFEFGFINTSSSLIYVSTLTNLCQLRKLAKISW